MRQPAYLGMSLSLIVMAASAALPGFSQAAQAKAPVLRTQPEYNAYTACYSEKDPAKKGDFCEKFIADFKDSDFITNGYTLTLQSYTAQKNWAKLMDAADRAVALPAATPQLKAFAYASGMTAAQNTANVDKVLSYGDKVLSIEPNDVNTLMIVSSTIPQKYPADKAQLDKAAEMAAKGLTGIQALMSKASAQEKPQLTQAEGVLHGTLAFVAYNEKDYKKSIAEYQSAIKDNVKDDNAHFFLAYDYINLMSQSSKDYQAALKAENDAKAAKADQPTIDDLAAKRANFEDEIRKYRDMVIDELALATAISGPYAAQAKDQLTKQWMAKNNDSAGGLDEFIAQKKTQIGG